MSILKYNYLLNAHRSKRWIETHHHKLLLNKLRIKMETCHMIRDLHFWNKVLESRTNTSKNINSQKWSEVPLPVLEKQLLFIKLLGLVHPNYTKESNLRLVETSKWSIRHRDNRNFINFNNYKIPRIHILYLLINPRDKLLLARKWLPFHHLQVSQDILDPEKPRLPVSKVKHKQLIRSQSLVQFKINTANKISLTWVKMISRLMLWMKWKIHLIEKFNMKKFQIKKTKFRWSRKTPWKLMNLSSLRNTPKKQTKMNKRKHKTRKKRRLMKTHQSKRKRLNIRTKEFSSQPKLRWILYNKCSEEASSGLRFKLTLPPCPKRFSIDKSATVEAGSPTIILKAEGAKVHWRCLLANWWPTWIGSTKTKPRWALATSTTVDRDTTKRTSSMPNTIELSPELFMSSQQSMWSTLDPRAHMPRWSQDKWTCSTLRIWRRWASRHPSKMQSMKTSNSLPPKLRESTRDLKTYTLMKEAGAKSETAISPGRLRRSKTSLKRSWVKSSIPGPELPMKAKLLPSMTSWMGTTSLDQRESTDLQPKDWSIWRIRQPITSKRYMTTS